MIRGSKVTFARLIPLHKNICLRLGRSIPLHRNRCFCVCTFVFIKNRTFSSLFHLPEKVYFWSGFLSSRPRLFLKISAFLGPKSACKTTFWASWGRPETGPKPSAGPERPGDPKRTPKEAQRGPKGPQTDPWDPKIVSKVTQK